MSKQQKVTPPQHTTEWTQITSRLREKMSKICKVA